MKLTDKLVKTLPAPAKGYTIHYDDGVRGFGLRVTAGNAHSWLLRFYTQTRKERSFTIGSADDWPVATAREEARKLRREIDTGGDPLARIEAAREAVDKANAAPTMQDLADRYRLEHLGQLRASTKCDGESMLRADILPVWKHRKVAEITSADVKALHQQISQRAKMRANAVVMLLSTMFNLAIQWGMVERNPTKGVKKHTANKRERFLDADELGRLNAALDQLEDQSAADAVRLLLLTGSRCGEVLGATWGEIDLQAGVWVRTAERNKQKRSTRIPLSGPALDLLKAMKATSRSEFVFPGRGPAGHRMDLKKPWAALCKAARLDGVRLHDLRHSYASLLINAGFSLPIIGQLLGHSSPQTTSRYAHLALDTTRAATERVGEVISLSRRRAA